MNTINYGSIRTSLFLLVLLVFIPLFFIVCHSARQYKLSTQRFATENALHVARNLAQQQKLIESNTKQFLEVLSQLPEIKSKDTTLTNRLLASLLKQNRSYASLLLVNTAGDMIAAGLPFVKLNVSDRKYFKDVVSTKSFAVGEYTRSRLTQKPVIHYAYPVMDQNKLKAVLVVSLNLNYYDEIFNKSNLGENSIFTFLDHRGVILYQSQNNLDNAGKKDQSKIFAKMQGKNAEATFLASGSDSISRLYGYEQLCLNGNQPYMYIYVGIPEKIAYAEFHKILTYNIMIWVAGVLLVILSAYFFSLKSIINPIDRLVKTAGMIAEGDLETRTGMSNHKTELGMLALAIDEMTDKLFRREMEQKKTQKDLRRLKERFELAINAAHIGIWDWHIRNNTLLWDKNMFDLYGIKHEGFDYRFESWMELVYPTDLVYLEAEILNAIEYHRPFRSEFRIVHPIYGMKHIRIFASVIDDKEGKPVRLIGVNWDITERKILERRLGEAKDKAETSDRLKSAFLANVSHEIRTPLHGIIGFAQILKENEISEQERIQYLDIIVGSGNKLMDIISNIIDISMLEAGQLKILNCECNVYTLLRDIYDHYEKIRIINNKGFSFIFEPEIEENMPLAIDEFRFRQILSNLLDNAFKFTEKGKITMGCRIFNDELLCYVKDTGIGIQSENLNKIFDRFKQIDDSNHRTYSGNGLGLSICKGLLDLMEGRIWAVSNQKGSEFYFSLSLKPVEEARTIVSSGNSLFA
jgi:signal transduction histidine kinase/HAMP domain-containing protein